MSEHYFSRIRLKAETPDLTALGRLATRDLYREHRLIWSFFPGDSAAKRDFIYRRDAELRLQDGAGERPRLGFHVVSHRHPTDESGLWEVDTRPYAPQLETGDRLEFSLRANPVSRSRKARPEEAIAQYQAQRLTDGKSEAKDPRRRKRDDIMKLTVQNLQRTYGDAWKAQFDRVELADEAGRCWLESQSQRNGFELEEAAVTSYSYDSFTPRRGETVEVGRMDFTGRLRVTDPARFIEILSIGLGPAKAFGCGLLLVRRV